MCVYCVIFLPIGIWSIHQVALTIPKCVAVTKHMYTRLRSLNSFKSVSFKLFLIPYVNLHHLIIDQPAGLLYIICSICSNLAKLCSKFVEVENNEQYSLHMQTPRRVVQTECRVAEVRGTAMSGFSNTKTGKLLSYARTGAASRHDFSSGAIVLSYRLLQWMKIT